MTQTEKIRAHLNRGEGITHLEALRLYNCSRLAARVLDLRNEGMQIDSEMVTVGSGKKVARYSKAKPAFELVP